MDEYRLKVTIKNNLILNAIEERGYTNLNNFCKGEGLKLNNLYDLINLKIAPIGVDGRFIKPAQDLMEVLGACPTDLWTEEQLTLKLQTNTVTKTLNKEKVDIYLSSGNSHLILDNPANVFEKEDDKKLISQMLNSLSPRESKILKLRFGLENTDEHTLEEVGDKYHSHRERIRQLEARALRKMRHPSRSESLKELLYKNEGEE
jgi:RNA polymerase primary sigma factor